ncbi:MAG: glycosyltransferase [Chloroflexi bacterium]|nr:glycosyltransferase [Chloroflexota bacterium]
MITVVLPAYNEENSIGPLLSRVSELMGRKHFPIRVIVVDDGSKDKTAENAKRAMPEAVVISHDGNKGLGEAIKTGLLAALEASTEKDIIVTMDSDDSHAPALIGKMVERIEEGCDVVIASRYLPESRVVGVSFYRQVLSIGASLLFRMMYPIPGVRDYTCGYRAYRAAVLKVAFERWGNDFVNQTGFSVMVDILLKLSRLNVVCAEVPIILRYDRKPGASKMNVRRTIMQTLNLLVKHRFGKIK